MKTNIFTKKPIRHIKIKFSNYMMISYRKFGEYWIDTREPGEMLSLNKVQEQVGLLLEAFESIVKDVIIDDESVEWRD